MLCWSLRSRGREGREGKETTVRCHVYRLALKLYITQVSAFRSYQYIRRRTVCTTMDDAALPQPRASLSYPHCKTREPCREYYQHLKSPIDRLGCSKCISTYICISIFSHRDCFFVDVDFLASRKYAREVCKLCFSNDPARKPALRVVCMISKQVQFSQALRWYYCTMGSITFTNISTLESLKQSHNTM